MTTRQLAKRLGVQQPRVIELERGEASGNISMQTLQRAAGALGCRLVYVLIPEAPMKETIRQRAALAAERQLAQVDQTMALEAQGVTNEAMRNESLRRLMEELVRRPARLWDEL
jgi:predicted DNA-binding mobile mystery protein A